MTSDQQHHIRNGLLCLLGIAKRLELTALTDDQTLLVIEIRKQVRRIGFAAELKTIKYAG